MRAHCQFMMQRVANLAIYLSKNRNPRRKSTAKMLQRYFEYRDKSLKLTGAKLNGWEEESHIGNYVMSKSFGSLH